MPRSWTIMIYFAGDNNLGEEMIWALKDIENWRFSHEGQAQKDNVKVMALFETMGPEIPIDFDDLAAARYRASSAEYVRKRKTPQKAFLEARQEVLAAPGGQPDGKVQPVGDILKKFMMETIDNFPAERYMLVLSGHGSGAVGDFLPGDKRIVSLTIPKLGKVLREVREQLGKEIEILGMDACQMNMTEVACEVQNAVKFMVGAEGFTPNTGWPYERVLGILNNIDPAKNIAVQPKDFAEKIVQQYIGYYLDFTAADLSTDISVLDLSRFSAVQDRLVDFTNALGITKETKRKRVEREKQPGATPSQLLTDMIGATALADASLCQAMVLARRDAQGYKREQYVDLWGFCERLIANLDELEKYARLKEESIRLDGEATKEVKEAAAAIQISSVDKYNKLKIACEALLNAIDPRDETKRGTGMVRLSGYCGPRFEYSFGLSIFFPWQSLMDAAGTLDLDHYDLLEFPNKTLWGEFLRVFLAATQRPVRKRYTKGDVLESLLNMRTGLFTDGPGKDPEFSTADKDPEFSTADKGKFGVSRIESMKNPPIEWRECQF